MNGPAAPRVAVLGAGRMGQELIMAIAGDEGVALAGVWARDARKLLEQLSPARKAALEAVTVSEYLESALGNADVAVDFTLPAATSAVLEAVSRRKLPLVCGVSGLNETLMQRMREVATAVPVFYDRNMSFGIAVLTDLVRRTAAVLGPEFLAEIHERHHVHKIDAPSGTALKLGEALAAARGQDFARVYRYDESDPTRRDSPDDIVFRVRREGEVPGEHSVCFRSGAETLELKHAVEGRRVFAEGALRAARWLVGQPPGFYQMGDLARTSGSTPLDAPVK